MGRRQGGEGTAEKKDIDKVGLGDWNLGRGDMKSKVREREILWKVRRGQRGKWARLDRVRGKEWSSAGERRWSSSKGEKRIWKSAWDIIDDVYVRRRHSTWPSVIASV